MAKKIWNIVQIPILALIMALLVAALVIIFTAENPLVGLEKVGAGYYGILDGAVLSVRGLTNSLVKTTPLILTGLAVAIPFRAGLFNIGAEGQYVMGALLGVLVAINVPLPPVIHPIVVMFAGFIGGALWAAIPGILRAYLGAHEVINTIMLNFIAIGLMNYGVRGPFKDPNPSNVQTLPILETAELPQLFGTRLHLGFFIALLMAALAYYFLFRTTWGFAVRTTGLNQDAAEYAGIRSKMQYIIGMMIGGGFAGMGGAIEVQGITHVLTEGFNAGYGFDAIAISLLALNNPLAVIPAAFIFGILNIGGDFLQIRAGLSVHIVSMFRALILLFVSAPAIVRWLFRLAPESDGTETAAAG